MSNDFSDILRTLTRETCLQEREKSRNDLFNKGRHLDPTKSADKTYSTSDVRELVKDLRRSSNKEASLSALKSAFIQNRTNAIEFLKIEGAIHSLIGNLMGQNPTVQLLAVECCCNLSLGDAKTCYQLAKSAGPYLVTILRGMNYNLMNYSLLTLGNICASSKKSVKLIKSQGALQAFQHTIDIPELRESTAYALVLYTKSSLPEDSTDLIGITNIVIRFLEGSTNVQWLLFHLSSFDAPRSILVEQQITERVLKQLVLVGCVGPDNVSSVTCLIRALANLSSEKSGSVALALFSQWDSLFTLAKGLVSSEYTHLRPEVTWLFGNLVNHPSPRVQEAVALHQDDLIWIGRCC